MGTVAELWRHPIKAHGREAVESASFSIGKCMPWDRHWAVTHDATKFDGTEWANCRNFMIGARTPSLAGIWASFDETSGNMTLRHQDCASITFNPDEDDSAFLKWVAPLCPPDRVMPNAIVKADGRGMTDSDFASVSIMNRASHLAVQDAIGHPLEQERWRANIWLDGVEAWDELGWIGKTVRIGGAEFEIRMACERCELTAANPVTGVRDAKTLNTLENTFGHKHFGVYAVVSKDGPVALGDTCEVL
jgi:uncharacterized protein YcbX